MGRRRENSGPTLFIAGQIDGRRSARAAGYGSLERNAAGEQIRAWIGGAVLSPRRGHNAPSHRRTGQARKRCQKDFGRAPLGAPPRCRRAPPHRRRSGRRKARAMRFTCLPTLKSPTPISRSARSKSANIRSKNPWHSRFARGRSAFRRVQIQECVETDDLEAPVERIRHAILREENRLPALLDHPPVGKIGGLTSLVAAGKEITGLARNCRRH